MRNKREKRRNVLYLILAIVIAVGVWYYVDESSGRTVVQTVTDIPIEYTGLSELTDNGLMLVEGEGSGTDAFLDITFEGARRHVVQLEREDIRVTASLSGFTKAGVQDAKYTMSYTNRKFNATNITVKEYSADNARVNICELSHKEVEVRCELTGNVAEGYSAGKVQLSQSVIEIRGQEEDISRVSYAKVAFDVGRNARETVTALLDYRLCDENGQEVNSTNIHTDIEQIQATLPVYVTKELKLAVSFQQVPGALLEDMIWAIKPESIMVSGDASILNNMDMIVLDTFDLLGVTTESMTHSYAILVPDGCENLSGVTRATLEIGYPDRAMTNITTANIQITNPPADREVELLTEALTISVFGRAETVETVTDEDIIVTADLSDYAVASGTYMVPVQVETTAGDALGISGTYQVQVRIPEQPGTEEDTGESE